MKVYVDIGSFWGERLSINQVYENLVKQGKKIDRRTLSAAKHGQLSKCEFTTLLRLRDLASQLAGRHVTLDELFKVEENV